MQLWLVPLIPLTIALMVILCGRWPNIREGVTLVGGVLLCRSVWALVQQRVTAGLEPWLGFELVPGMTFSFQADALGLLFALVASSLWLVTSVYAIGYMRAHHEKKQTAFYSAFALAIAATMGIALAANLFTLFVCYEILTLSTYPLVIHAGSREARLGGRTYLGILLATSIGLFLVAVVGTWLLAGTLDFTPGGILRGKAQDNVIAVLLLLFLFGIGKAALMPAHRWLPAAMVAPTPVSALLHAVAVVKAGVFTVLKVVVFIVGSDFFHRPMTGNFDFAAMVHQGLIYVAVASLVLASVQALRQDNLKRRLAYSTISQLAYIVLGALLVQSLSLVGAAMHIATHALGKIVLFFAAGGILVATGKTRVSELRGLGRQMPITFGCFLLASLSVIGLPLFGGFWSKWYLALGTVATGQWLALAALMASSLLSIAYLLPVVVTGFWIPVHESEKSADTISTSVNEHIRLKEAPGSCLLAMLIALCGSLYLFFQPQPLFELATEFSRAALSGPVLPSGNLAEGVSP